MADKPPRRLSRRDFLKLTGIAGTGVALALAVPWAGSFKSPESTAKPLSVFATSVSCMDGRVQEPIRRWIVDNYGVDYVDTVTEPGVDKVVAEDIDTDRIRSMIGISIGPHGSKTVVVSGHHDCAGNPVSKEAHIEHVRLSVENLRTWYPDIDIVGIWVGDTWQVEKVL